MISRSATRSAFCLRLTRRLTPPHPRLDAERAVAEAGDTMKAHRHAPLGALRIVRAIEMRQLLPALSVFLLMGCGSDSAAPTGPPTVTAVSPAIGPLAGGTSVTITGSNFIDVTTVTIGGGALGNRAVVSPGQITGVTSAAASLGAKDVVVSAAHGTGTCAGCFTYYPNTAARVVAGGLSTCALRSTGSAYCWGALSTGDNVTPVAVPGGLTFVTLAAGEGGHTCGLTSAGDAYCWGNDNWGQLGQGSSFGGGSATPVAVSGGLRFRAIVAGGVHTCGLTDAGAAYCWGYNGYGQLGNGLPSNANPRPVPVSGGLTFSTLAAGGQHTCGLTTTGAAYCWGYNQFGQVGGGFTGDRATPVAVAGGLTFVALTAGGVHSCGLASAGTAYCWGDNGYGELGNGDPTGPEQCYSGCSTRPVIVSGGLIFSAIVGSADHTCGLTGAGAAYCWGDNHQGQLGNGSATSSSIPVAVSGDLSFSAIALGGTHINVAAAGSHTCGLTTNSGLYCWGNNRSGQLGDGSTTNRSTPVAVSGWAP